MKKSILLLCACLITYTLLEVCSLIGHYFTHGELFSFKKAEIQRRVVMGQTTRFSKAEMEYLGPAFYEGNQVIHPYLGFVADPTVKEGEAGGWSVNQWGFFGSPPLFEKISDETTDYVIGIFGGSVAQVLAIAGIAPIIRELRENGIVNGKTIRIVPIAMGGIKEPQQLMALNYFLTLGAQFDIVLNLDGFNDIVLPYTENIRLGVFPFFPRNWATRVWGYTDMNFARALGKVEYLREWRKWLASVFSMFPLNLSITSHFLWSLTDSTIQKADAKVQTNVMEGFPNRQNLRYVATGPTRTYVDQEEMYRDFANMWGRASNAMFELAKAHGIHYFHFLQPNQYVPKSKIFTEKERKQAFDETSSWRSSVIQGYPHLKEVGKSLVNKGIPFFDMTMIFAENGETLYVDKCCHLNALGNELLGKAIGRVIVSNIRK